MSRSVQRLQRIAGLRAVAALFATEPGRVERLFFEESRKQDVGAFCALLAKARKPYRLVPSEELQRVAGTVLHGGVVAVAEARPLLPFDPQEAAGWTAEGALLLLDGIGNPHNLGAIARSAAYFGIARLVLSDHPEQAGLSDAAFRVAEGGLEHLKVYRASRFAATLETLRKSHRVIGTASQQGLPLHQLEPSPCPIALVLGNEETGLPPATLAACAEIVTIPGAGKVESLNVAASAAILLYALRAPTTPLSGGRNSIHRSN